jgi:hypothetical protein
MFNTRATVASHAPQKYTFDAIQSASSKLASGHAPPAREFHAIKAPTKTSVIHAQAVIEALTISA